MKNRRSRGNLIAIEGLDGSGKSTLVRFLDDTLRKTGFDVLSIALPWSNGVAGADLNDIVRVQSRKCSSATLALAFAANRSDQSAAVVVPWLARSDDSIVLADRHIGSGLAYQMLDGLDVHWLLEINREVRFPDLVLYIDTPPEICKNRVAERRVSSELFEERFEATRLSYLRALQKLASIGVNVEQIDGAQSTEDVCADAIRIIERSLGRIVELRSR